MCGRFVSARKRLELLEEFGVERDRVAASPDPEPAPDYNVAPTKKIFALLLILFAAPVTAASAAPADRAVAPGLVVT